MVPKLTVHYDQTFVTSYEIWSSLLAGMTRCPRLIIYRVLVAYLSSSFCFFPPKETWFLLWDMVFEDHKKYT